MTINNVSKLASTSQPPIRPITKKLLQLPPPPNPLQIPRIRLQARINRLHDRPPPPLRRASGLQDAQLATGHVPRKLAGADFVVTREGGRGAEQTPMRNGAGASRSVVLVIPLGVAAPVRKERVRAVGGREDLAEAGIGLVDEGGEAAFSGAVFVGRADASRPVGMGRGQIEGELAEDFFDVGVLGGVCVRFFLLVEGGEVGVPGVGVLEVFGEVVQGFLADGFGDVEDEVVDDVAGGAFVLVFFVGWLGWVLGPDLGVALA